MIDANKLEEYKILIEDTARFSERRQRISNTYVSVNSLLLATIAFLLKDINIQDFWILFLPLPLIISGILISILEAAHHKIQKFGWFTHGRSICNGRHPGVVWLVQNIPS